MIAIETLVANGRAKPTRAPRPAKVFDRDGKEVFITMICPHCRRTKPLGQFGLRKMGDGKIRNAPWCKACRAHPGVKIVVRARP